MRFSSLQNFNRGTGQMIDLSAQVHKTQNQIDSGTRLLTASEDPVASSQVFKLEQEGRVREQYTDNITLLNTRLALEEAALGSVNDILIRVKELTIQGNNGSLGITDREAIVAELSVRQEELADLMNTRDASGEYLFAGFKGSTQPFVDNGVGNYTYQGDEGQRFIQIASSTRIASNDAGKTVFVDVDSAQPTFRTSENPSNRANPPALVSAGLVRDQEAFNEVYPEDFIIEFQNPDDMLLIGQPAGLNYNIIQKSDGRVVQSNVPFRESVAVEFSGVELTIAGSPSVGDTYMIESTDNQDILTTLSRLIDGMSNLSLSPEDQETYQQLMADSLVNVDNAQTSVLEVRAEIGARMNTLQTTQELHEEVDVISVGLISSLKDLDYAEAVSQLTFESFVLQAAQQSYAKISGLSLFNSI